MRLRTYITTLVSILVLPCTIEAWTEYRITTSPSNQGNPKISGNIVVWGDSGPIKGADINDPNTPVYFELPHNPSDLGGNIIVWYENPNIYGYDLTDSSQFLIASNKTGWLSTDGETVVYKDSANKVYGYDLYWESEFEVPVSISWGGPKVDGDCIVWNVAGDAVYLFDMTIWQTFRVTDKPAAPDISGNLVVSQILNNGDNNIYCTDISDTCNPIESLICGDVNEQRNPSISGNIIVWQDNRNGNWDIYGYDLSTETEFQITDNIADQTYPAISGHTVVWKDMRHGQTDIYATILYGSKIPKCSSPPQGDLNNDCKVDFSDFAILINNWLECNLDPPEACLD